MKAFHLIPANLLLLAAAMMVYQKIRTPSAMDGGKLENQIRTTGRASRAYGQFTMQVVERQTHRPDTVTGMESESNMANSRDEIDSENERLLLEKMSDWNVIE